MWTSCAKYISTVDWFVEFWQSWKHKQPTDFKSAIRGTQGNRKQQERTDFSLNMFLSTPVLSICSSTSLQLCLRHSMKHQMKKGETTWSEHSKTFILKQQESHTRIENMFSCGLFLSLSLWKHVWSVQAVGNMIICIEVPQTRRTNHCSSLYCFPRHGRCRHTEPECCPSSPPTHLILLPHFFAPPAEVHAPKIAYQSAKGPKAKSQRAKS